MSSITDLKFLTAEEQDAMFKVSNRMLGTLLIQGRMTREGHRAVLEAIRLISDTWFKYQSNEDGTARPETRPLE